MFRIGRYLVFLPAKLVNVIQQFMLINFHCLSNHRHSTRTNRIFFAVQVSLLLQGFFQAFILFINKWQIMNILCFEMHHKIYYLMVVYLCAISYCLTIEIVAYKMINRKYLTIIEHFINERWSNTVWFDCGVDNQI